MYPEFFGGFYRVSLVFPPPVERLLRDPVLLESICAERLRAGKEHDIISAAPTSIEWLPFAVDRQRVQMGDIPADSTDILHPQNLGIKVTCQGQMIHRDARGIIPL